MSIVTTTPRNGTDACALSTLMSSQPREAIEGRTECHVGTDPGSDKGHESGAASLPLHFSYWDRTTFLSDFIATGLDYLDSHEPRRPHQCRRRRRAIMLYEAPSTYATGTTFRNAHQFRVHDYPPAPLHVKTVMDPCRYALANGSAYPVYLKDGNPPLGLVEHWQATIPDWVKPSFTQHRPASSTLHNNDDDDDDDDGDDPVLTDDLLVYAYLPCEAMAGDRHVIDPAIHHYLCGKDVLPLITRHTPRLLPSTQPRHRPCIVKPTHASGGRGIFVIRSDRDEEAFQAYWEEAHRPPFVVTELVQDIRRNVACHFFLHPNGQDITLLGSSENFRFGDRDDNSHGPRNPNLPFSSDSYWSWSDQDLLRDMQIGLVEAVARYCHSLGFWGFCGIDVLLDGFGRTHLIDVNPRVTGSLPSLVVANLFHGRFGFEHGIFRRSGPATYYQGPSRQLLEDVTNFNRAHLRECQVVVFSFFELRHLNQTVTKIQVGVYGRFFEQCRQVLGEFAKVLGEE